MKMMNPVTIESDELKTILYKISDKIFSEDYSDIFSVKEFSDKWWKEIGNKRNRETLSERYLEHLRNYPHRHIGFPEGIKGIDIRHSGDNLYYNTVRYEQNKDELIQKWEILTNEMNDLNRELSEFLSARSSAYFAFYPPDGYIGWHSNHNASGYNILLSISEKGTGFFEHIDSETGEKYREEDPKDGTWSCKVGYFGKLEEPERMCWHSAQANGSRRITVSYIVPDETLWTLMRQDIETP